MFIAVEKFVQKIPLQIWVVSLSMLFGVGLWGATKVIIPIGSPASPPSMQATSNAPKAKIVSHEIISGEPTRIVIKGVGIDIPVEKGSYSDKTGWALSDGKAFFVTTTTRPNDNRGGTFIYAHNRRDAFWPLKDLRSGDKVVIKTSNGHEFTYSYSYDNQVDPDAVEALKYDPDKPVLTLMTCEGAFSKTRRLMYFDFVQVK